MGHLVRVVGSVCCSRSRSCSTTVRWDARLTGGSPAEDVGTEWYGVGRAGGVRVKEHRWVVGQGRERVVCGGWRRKKSLTGEEGMAWLSCGAEGVRGGREEERRPFAQCPSLWMGRQRHHPVESTPLRTCGSGVTVCGLLGLHPLPHVRLGGHAPCAVWGGSVVAVPVAPRGFGVRVRLVRTIPVAGAAGGVRCPRSVTGTDAVFELLRLVLLNAQPKIFFCVLARPAPLF